MVLKSFMMTAAVGLPLWIGADAAYAEDVAVGAGLTVKVVSLDAGRLVLKGTAAKANMTIRVVGTKIVIKSKGDKSFAIESDFRPDDCRLTLKTATGSLPLLVSGCGPKGDTGPSLDPDVSAIVELKQRQRRSFGDRLTEINLAGLMNFKLVRRDKIGHARPSFVGIGRAEGLPAELLRQRYAHVHAPDSA